jgi:peptidoglycan/LPS O-acetylase OafA/YrhL
MPKQLVGLELLRGLCAVLVASYHCLTWSGAASPHSWGLYGVYIFFVISGAVLYHNYHATLSHDLSVPVFLLKRIARLAPLYIACVLATAIVSGNWPLRMILLNVTMLFGFVNPGTTSVVTGGWTLGIEFVLYLLFPVLLTLTRPIKVAVAVFSLLVAVRIAHTEMLLRNTTLEESWSAYTQVGSFVAFFFGGMLLAKFAPRFRRWSIPVSLVCAALLIVYPGESATEAVTGWLGFAYMALCFAIAAGFFWVDAPKVLTAVSRFFGEISYGVYLIHPLLWALLSSLDSLPRAVATILGSAALAWVVLRIYERPAKRLILGAPAKLSGLLQAS